MAPWRRWVPVLAVPRVALLRSGGSAPALSPEAALDASTGALMRSGVIMSASNSTSSSSAAAPAAISRPSGRRNWARTSPASTSGRTKGGTWRHLHERGPHPVQGPAAISEHFEHAGHGFADHGISLSNLKMDVAKMVALQGQRREAEQRRHLVPLQEEQGQLLPRPWHSPVARKAPHEVKVGDETLIAAGHHRHWLHRTPAAGPSSTKT